MNRLPTILLLLLSAASILQPARADAPPTSGVPITYQLPTTGPLPRTYRVTLAIVDPKNPAWIISQFLSGATRTVTPENGGRFTESWDGLEDNFMPVPPGTYALKGIYMPAERWKVDGEYHSIVPQFIAGASSWMPTPEQWNVPEPFGGDPTGQPLGDVDVGPNGVAVFYYVYLENGLNNPLMDLKKPQGLGQFIRAFGSGGAAGGTSTCTDGQTVWSFSTDGGQKFIYRADGKPFGADRGAYRPNVTIPDGWVTGMACWHDPQVNRTFVYAAQRGRIVPGKNGRDYAESATDFVDTVTVHDGDNGKILARLPVHRPQGIAARNGVLYLLHAAENGGWEVGVVPLQAGLPQGAPQRLFSLPANLAPFDIEADSRGRIYVSDPAANKVYQFDRSGSILRTYGRLEEQKPGSYDPLTLMSPGKLATWTDPDGSDRLIVVEQDGPNRASEWSADGKLLREYLSLQTHANDGWTVDPDHPDEAYLLGHGGWLTRFHLDYDHHAWTVDAVWPGVGTDPMAPGFDHPQFINLDGRKYLACGRSNNVYRLDGSRWVLSAAIFREKQGNDWQTYAWHDANGDGKVEEDEYRNHPLQTPPGVIRYHGNQWLQDLSLVAIQQGSRDVWRLAPSGFDAHGNPVFEKWQKLLTDPVFEARAAGTADAIHGGNELDDRYSSDWAMVDGSMQDGFYVDARGGRNFSANNGAQTKISRYVPDGKGGYRLLWRTGRQALEGVAKEGEIYGAIHVWKPINGLLSVVDQSRCGILLYTNDGLYVDTLFPDGRRFPPATAGIYPQPGEFFAGSLYPDRATGRIYLAMGKITPLVFGVQGWSLTQNPAHPLTTVQPTVTIAASQVASPPEMALTLRGGPGIAKVARFAPALGGAVLDGSMAGWESADPVRFAANADQTVEVRCLYDPDHLYLRWHARVAEKVDPKPLQPLERIFTHDRGADTLSFYIQGDPSARPGGPAGGRPGDARIVFGLFRDGDAVKPAALGLYPTWNGPGAPTPLTYRTPVGQVHFASVGPVPGIQLNAVLDPDEKGYVLTAAIPRSSIPGLPPLGNGVRTMVDFEATYGGHNKFWWSNADGSASRETYDEPTEARLYPGAWAPAQFQGIESGMSSATG